MLRESGKRKHLKVEMPFVKIIVWHYFIWKTFVNTWKTIHGNVKRTVLNRKGYQINALHENDAVSQITDFSLPDYS